MIKEPVIQPKSDNIKGKLFIALPLCVNFRLHKTPCRLYYLKQLLTFLFHLYPYKKHLHIFMYTFKIHMLNRFVKVYFNTSHKKIKKKS